VCPYFPSNAEKFHYNFPDPSKLNGTEDEIHAEFLRVRNLIKVYCDEFVQHHL
jgi:arsenate reductase